MIRAEKKFLENKSNVYFHYFCLAFLGRKKKNDLSKIFLIVIFLDIKYIKTLEFE